MVSKDEKTMAVLAHILGIVAGFIPSLIIFLVKKDSKFVRSNAVNALNFQISLIIYYLIAGALTFVLVGILLFPVLWIFGLVVMIMAAVEAGEGRTYEYPLCIKFIH